MFINSLSRRREQITSALSRTRSLVASWLLGRLPRVQFVHDRACLLTQRCDVATLVDARQIEPHTKLPCPDLLKGVVFVTADHQQRTVSRSKCLRQLAKSRRCALVGVDQIDERQMDTLAGGPPRCPFGVMANNQIPSDLPCGSSEHLIAIAAVRGDQTLVHRPLRFRFRHRHGVDAGGRTLQFGYWITHELAHSKR